MGGQGRSPLLLPHVRRSRWPPRLGCSPRRSRHLRRDLIATSSPLEDQGFWFAPYTIDRRGGARTPATAAAEEGPQRALCTTGEVHTTDYPSLRHHTFPVRFFPLSDSSSWPAWIAVVVAPEQAVPMLLIWIYNWSGCISRWGVCCIAMGMRGVHCLLSNSILWEILRYLEKYLEVSKLYSVSFF